MINSGNCSLVIRGDNLNLVEIEENLHIKPSRIVRKGEVISKTIGESQYDVWVFEIGFGENKIPDKALEEILSTISSSKTYLQSLISTVDIKIKCYVQSDYAQFCFEISPNVLKELASMNIKLEISILSWGGVKS